MQSFILPSRVLLAILAAWLGLALLALWLPDLRTAWQAAGVLIGLWATLDFLRARALPPPALQRVVSASLPLGEWSRVELRLHWPAQAPSQVDVFDHMPSAFSQEGLPARIASAGRNSFALRYRVKPLARGEHRFAGCQLRMRSPWQAWLRSVVTEDVQHVRVFPNFAPLARHVLRAVDPRLARTGLHKRRLRGQGMDFAQLREYREGDPPRQIDWKATTRMGKVISREYQEERDQRILLLVDCGRRMGARDDALSHFDHVLNAVLLLAYVGLRHGDQVGLMTLGGPERFVPTQRTRHTVGHILNAIYDLEPSLQASDFEMAAQQLLRRERKRALVVLFTNLRDEDDEGLLGAARLLNRHHLVLVASLRETALDTATGLAADDLQSAATLAAAVDYRQRREATLRRLRAEGILCLDVTPQQLAVESINRYLAIKAASQL